MTDPVEPVRIVRLAAGGDGVGHLPDGRAVFVPRSAPGELVELRQLRVHRRFARARLGALVEPSASRVVPPCPHYTVDDCGGCQLQHLNDAAQRAARAMFVGDALRRIARLDAPDPELVPADRVFGYRTKLTLHVAAGGRRIGLHPVDRPDQVFELDWCHITDDALNRLWQAVRRERTRLPPALVQVVLRLDRRGGRHLLLAGGGAEAWTGGPALGAALARRGADAIVWWEPEGGAPRVVAGGDEVYPATIFEQVHPAMGDLVRAHALAQAGAVAGRLVWDLYAGLGETTELLLALGADVDSVEVDRRAVNEAVRCGAALGPTRVRRLAGRVEDRLSELRAPAVVVTNPPRTGMDERVTAALAAGGAARIVYISCDPATLARDLTRLAPVYRVAGVRSFDLFPQTAHVETVAVLERA